MLVITPQGSNVGQVAQPPGGNLIFTDHVPHLLIGRASWWVDTPVPFLPSSVDSNDRPVSGSIISLSKAPAKIKYQAELKEYWNEGDTFPVEIRVMKESFSVSANFLSLHGRDSLFDLLAGGRTQQGTYGATTGGIYNRRPVTMIARNLNPKATGRRLVVCSIYSAYGEGYEFDIDKSQASVVTATFKAARPKNHPFNVGIGRLFFL